MKCVDTLTGFKYIGAKLGMYEHELPDAARAGYRELPERETRRLRLDWLLVLLLLIYLLQCCSCSLWAELLLEVSCNLKIQQRMCGYAWDCLILQQQQQQQQRSHVAV